MQGSDYPEIAPQPPSGALPVDELPLDYEFRYKKHLQYMRYIFSIFFLVIAMGFWWYFNSLKGEYDYEGFEDDLYFFRNIFLVAFIFLSLFIWFFYGLFTKVRVILNDEFIAYMGFFGTKTHPINSITHLNLPMIKYTGGWIKIIFQDGRNIRLAATFGKFGVFLRRLKYQLDRRGMSGAYDYQKFFSVVKTAEMGDRSFGIIHEFRWKYLAIIGSYLLIGSALTLLSGIGILGWILTFASAFAAPYFNIIMMDYLLISKIGKQSDIGTFQMPPRDRLREMEVFKTGVIVYGIIYGLITAVLLIMIFILKTF